MMTISSGAGRRLAVAKFEMDLIKAQRPKVVSIGVTPEYETWSRRDQLAKKEFRDAAAVVAQELIKDGFHMMEGS